MEKVTLENPNKIGEIIRNNNLINIVLETGNENVYIPNKNKFVVTKKFLVDKISVFAMCRSLQMIDLYNFDFSEITTMQSWFWNCIKLTKIIFPQKMQCDKLIDLEACFSSAKALTTIDLSWMSFKNTSNTLSLGCTFMNNANIKKIILPKCEAHSISCCFSHCPNVEEIIAPITFQLNKDDFVFETFYQCDSLKIVNFADGHFDSGEFIKQVRDTENENELSEDCIIVLP